MSDVPPSEDAAVSAPSITPEAAQAAVAANIQFDTQRIINILTSLYGDSGLVGGHVAEMQLGEAGGDFAEMLPDINWSTWTPGDPETAALVANGGLRQLLDEINITIKGMTDAAIDRIGNVLAEGINEGLSNQKVAQNMKDLIADPKRAFVIARTETARATGVSTLDTFKDEDIAQWTWNPTDGACPICLKYAAEGPYDVGSGPTFPGHPNCRCDPRAVLDIDAQKGFDPGELRGPDGKWIHVGGSGNFVSHHDKPRHGYGDIRPNEKMIKSLSKGSAAKYMNDKGEFTAERQALHDKIVDDTLAGTEPVHAPKFVMMGGGAASGKTNMIKSGVIDTDNMVLIDPDKIKLQLPDVKKMSDDENDKWAGFGHEESSYLSSRIQAASLETRRNVLLDGTGDSDLEKLHGKIDAARAAGHTVEGHYTTVNVDEALARAEKRAQKTGRKIDENVIRQTYAGISTIFPKSVHKFDRVRMYDNNGTMLKLIARSDKQNDFRILDQDAYTDFLKNKDAING